MEDTSDAEEVFLLKGSIRKAKIILGFWEEAIDYILHRYIMKIVKAT
jgi:hypothetical protein